MFSLILNHPFVDGDKGVGTLAAAVMLEMNGVQLREDAEWLSASEAIAWRAARAEASREEVAAILRSGAV